MDSIDLVSSSSSDEEAMLESIGMGKNGIGRTRLPWRSNSTVSSASIASSGSSSVAERNPPRSALPPSLFTSSASAHSVRAGSCTPAHHYAVDLTESNSPPRAIIAPISSTQNMDHKVAAISVGISSSSSSDNDSELDRNLGYPNSVPHAQEHSFSIPKPTKPSSDRTSTSYTPNAMTSKLLGKRKVSPTSHTYSEAAYKARLSSHAEEHESSSSSSRSSTSSSSSSLNRFSQRSTATSQNQTTTRMMQAPQLTKREMAQQQREQTKASVKATKAREKLMQQCVLGKFSHVELGVAFEKRLATSPVGQAFQTHLEASTIHGRETPYTILPAFDSQIRSVVKFSWRSYFRGGADGSSSLSSSSILPPTLTPPPELVPFVLLHLSGVEFVRAVIQQKFETVSELIRSLRVLIRQPQARVCLLVQSVNDALVKIGRSRRGCTRERAQVQDQMFAFISKLFIQFKCVTKFTIDLDDACQYLVALTRELAAVPYREKDQMLDFIPRLSSFRVRPDGTTCMQSNAWLHFLQMIPGVSENKAQKILNFYPNIESLMRVYLNRNLSVEQKERALMDKMGMTNSKTLSLRIYRVLCSTNPHEVVS